jgi:NADH:ubiquinone oxidoreductase subunit
MSSLLMRLTSGLRGRKVGTDRFGNAYFEARQSLPVYGRRRRWVLFAQGKEPTTVPPEWHAWLHYTTDAPLPEHKLYAWQKDHRPNLTGTAHAYRPAGHDYVGGTRRITGGDYEAWTPGS